MDRAQMLKEGSDTLKTGTTTVGLVCSDGVILASDRRATMGYFIASKDVTKIFKIDERIAMTVAGSVADAQALVRMLQAETRLYQLRYGKPMTVKNAATLLANIMFQYKFFPYYVQLLIGGTEDKPTVFSIDPLGGTTEETYASTGSGSPMAYGLIENMYKKDGTVKENLPVAAKAISVAMRRDSATGESVDVVTLTKSGFRRLEKSEVAKLIES
ncbi:MAG: archaeal proteasome endopeptidase complex subunit beta [Candidatus Micrarchaeota archaeon]